MVVIHTRGIRCALDTLVGARGQITIKREIRETLGVRPKDIAVQRVQDGRLVVEFVRPDAPHTRSLAGILGPAPRRPREPLDIDDAVSRGVAEEWRQSGGNEVAGDRAAVLRARRRQLR
jgi:bifunctional DNA-binding transcriptional regulator/antitoxin component of YhaV-PrlF toxin-antitoxin module